MEKKNTEWQVGIIATVQDCTGAILPDGFAFQASFFFKSKVNDLKKESLKTQERAFHTVLL